MGKKCIHCGSETVEMNLHILKLCSPPLYLHTCSHCGATYYDNECGNSSYARFSLRVPDNYEKYTDFKKLYSDYKDMIDKHVNDEIDKRIRTISYDEIAPLNQFIKDKIEFDILKYRKEYSGYKNFEDVYKDYTGEINGEFCNRLDFFIKKINDIINKNISDTSTTDNVRQSLITIKNIINNNFFKYTYYETYTPLYAKMCLVEDKLRDFIYNKILPPTERFSSHEGHRKAKILAMFVDIFKQELEKVYKMTDFDNCQKNIIDTFNNILNDLKNEEHEIHTI